MEKRLTAHDVYRKMLDFHSDFSSGMADFSNNRTIGKALRDYVAFKKNLQDNGLSLVFTARKRSSGGWSLVYEPSSPKGFKLALDHLGNLHVTEKGETRKFTPVSSTGLDKRGKAAVLESTGADGFLDKQIIDQLKKMVLPKAKKEE